MQRVSENFHVDVSFLPKPIPGNWSGSGGHINFSTKAMRSENGMVHIKAGIGLLAHRREFHIRYYGLGNKQRLTGHHETACINTFSVGVAD